MANVSAEEKERMKSLLSDTYMDICKRDTPFMYLIILENGRICLII